MLVIPTQIAAEIVEHARLQAPVEACGLLAGNGSEVKIVYRMTNMDGSSEHYGLDPKEQFAAVKDMRARGMEMLALYHSHPATPARMSREDLRLALMPGIRYIIISLMDAVNPEIACFRVEEGQAVPEQVLIDEDVGQSNVPASG